MSGCVNCVWDIYREEFEEWKAATKQAKDKMEAQKGSKAAEKRGAGEVTEATSMDDDGGGSEALWAEASVKDEEDEAKDPFADVPVGIREFMRTEKMLKERQAAKQAGG